MSALPTLAVTGSTGFVGGTVARSLASAGTAQRLLVRDLSRAPALERAVALECAYSDRAASAIALDGVELLFMVSGAENKDRLGEHRSFIDTAVAAGAKRIVYTSFLGASADATFTLARDHYFTEEHIKASGLAYTFLRDAFYIDFMGMMAGEDGVIRGPAGDGRAAIVSRADVARVAVAVLRDPVAHENVTYNLTGREALTMAEIAAVLTEHGHSPVTFHNETIPEAYESRLPWEAPDWQNDAWVSTYTAIANGEVGTVSTDVEKVTGIPPETLAEFLDRTS